MSCRNIFVIPVDTPMILRKDDPEHGIAPGTAFADLPDNWVCPLCGVSKDMFQPCINNYN